LKVNLNTPAHINGLEAGDQVISINTNDVTKLTHQEAKMEITRAGNELVLTVIKYEYQSSR
jgi:C-terminal processing protease CtpA/Prc